MSVCRRLHRAAVKLNSCLHRNTTPTTPKWRPYRKGLISSQKRQTRLALVTTLGGPFYIVLRSRICFQNVRRGESFPTNPSSANVNNFETPGSTRSCKNSILLIFRNVAIFCVTSNFFDFAPDERYADYVYFGS